MPELLNIPKIEDRRGNLSFIEEGQLIPFQIGNVEWIYDVPSGSTATIGFTSKNYDIIIALSGAFELWTTNLEGKQFTTWLTRPNDGWLIEPNTFYEIRNCSSNSVILKITSAIVHQDFYPFEKGNNTDKDKEDKYGDEGQKKSKAETYQTSSVENCRVVAVENNSLYGKDSMAGTTWTLRSGTMAEPVVLEDGKKSYPFRPMRAYYLYDLPARSERGGHSHNSIYQMLIAVSGSFKVHLDDGKQKKTVTLNRPDQALLIVPGIWRTIDDFTSGATCLVLASAPYSEADYVREFSDFQKLTEGK